LTADLGKLSFENSRVRLGRIQMSYLSKVQVSIKGGHLILGVFEEQQPNTDVNLIQCLILILLELLVHIRSIIALSRKTLVWLAYK
jgi:hypothetical protein